MTDDRLNRLAILFIEFAFTIDMNVDNIQNSFAKKNVRGKLCVFFFKYNLIVSINQNIYVNIENIHVFFFYNDHPIL